MKQNEEEEKLDSLYVLEKVDKMLKFLTEEGQCVGCEMEKVGLCFTRL